MSGLPEPRTTPRFRIRTDDFEDNVLKSTSYICVKSSYIWRISIYVYSLIYLKLIYFEDREGFFIPKMNINLSYLLPICMLLLFKKCSDKKRLRIYEFIC